MKRLVSIFSLCLCIAFCDAQTNCDSIFQPDSQRPAALKSSYVDKLKRLQDYIEYMANPQQKVNNRRYYRTAALNLFVGQGNSYEKDGLICDGVTVSVYSANGSSCKKYLVKQFLSTLINRQDYPKYTINREVISLDVCEFRPISDDLYISDVYISLSACYDHRNDKPLYKDITRKRINWYVKVEQTDDGEEYEVLLGDIIVIERR